MDDPPDPEPAEPAREWVFYSLWPRIPEFAADVAAAPPAPSAAEG